MRKFFSISGTASNGMPVNRMIEASDEAEVRAYAAKEQITLSRLQPVGQQGLPLPPQYLSLPPTSDSTVLRLGNSGNSLLALGWLSILFSLLFVVCLIPIFLIPGILLVLGMILLQIGFTRRVRYIVLATQELGRPALALEDASSD
ncbi:hypothetical protein [Bremerella cremea]|uniref:hypothetical protein n=1 Tax=Bremerella cremea TaxID=1031537 RepID=UPI0031EF1BD3